MNVGAAKDLARQWVREEVAGTPGIIGAFFHGSAAWLPEDATLAATSDLDIVVVHDGSGPRTKIGKVRWGEVLLDVSFLPSEQLGSAEQVLGQYHLAGSFRTPSVILDGSGRLTKLQAAVGKEFAKRRWVRRRCEDAAERVRRHLGSVDEEALLHDRVTAWLFGAGVTTHLLLVAGLANPTVRTRYEAAWVLLAGYGLLLAHERLLGMLGCAGMDRGRVEEHVAALADAFDAAAAVIETPFSFASDMSPAARPIAIDGSRELIGQGSHREALFWVVATYARCMTVFAVDAPAARERFEPGFRRLLEDLGVGSVAELRRRSAEVEGALRWVWEVAEGIMGVNREIVD